MHMLVAVGMAAMFVSMGTEAGTGGDAARLTELVREVRTADYRGERAELRRLASRLDAVQGSVVAASASYWKGFALWRRAINGFNETPMPPDLRGDLEGAVASFRTALERRPDWVEPKIGISGCLMNLLFLARDDAAWRQALVDQFQPVWAETTTQGADNPRLSGFWGMQFERPRPGWGRGEGHRHAAQGSRGGTSGGAGAPQDGALAPNWGAAENLMNLAYVHSRGSGESKEVARAYAEGALAVAPDWHYVRDILLVQIDTIPQPAR